MRVRTSAGLYSYTYTSPLVLIFSLSLGFSPAVGGRVPESGYTAPRSYLYTDTGRRERSVPARAPFPLFCATSTHTCYVQRARISVQDYGGWILAGEDLGARRRRGGKIYDSPLSVPGKLLERGTKRARMPGCIPVGILERTDGKT